MLDALHRKGRNREKREHAQLVEDGHCRQNGQRAVVNDDVRTGSLGLGRLQVGRIVACAHRHLLAELGRGSHTVLNKPETKKHETRDGTNHPVAEVQRPLGGAANCGGNLCSSCLHQVAANALYGGVQGIHIDRTRLLEVVQNRSGLGARCEGIRLVKSLADDGCCHLRKNSLLSAEVAGRDISASRIHLLIPCPCPCPCPRRHHHILLATASHGLHLGCGCCGCCEDVGCGILGLLHHGGNARRTEDGLARCGVSHLNATKSCSCSCWPCLHL